MNSAAKKTQTNKEKKRKHEKLRKHNFQGKSTD